MLDGIALMALLAFCAALWIWYWQPTRILERHERQIRELQARQKYKQELEEDRCHFCQDMNTCSAFDIGVKYPCPYFKEEYHATKNNIRSIRFSDELAELIDRQVGRNFTEKFENLVTRCVWELPQKEAELNQLEEQIADRPPARRCRRRYILCA